LGDQIEPTTSSYVLKNENKQTEGYAEDGDMESDDFLNTENDLVVMDRANEEMEIGNDETTETSNNARQNKPMETTSFRNPVIECNNSNRTSSKAAGGDTRFQCHCGKSFSQKRHLYTHKKTHDNKFEALLRCSECGKKFATKQLLSRHVKSTHQGYFYECPICGKKQTQPNNSLTHIKNHHPGSGARPIEKCNK
jgi:KRAB domain-containing zinc finger protein